jgi:DNA-binding GntR family transcriptional regulator
MTSGRSMAPAKRRTLGDEVADRLRDAILTGEFVAGEHLREENLAAMLQVSRGPIRDAFGVLERDGLVVLSRHHGATVVELSREDLEEVYSLRIVLESLAARYAVKRAEESDLDLLTQALTTFTDQLAGHPSEQDAANLDVQFHDAFYRAAHHDRLYLAWSGIRLQVYRFLLTRNLANPDWRENMARGHTDIVDVLRSRDEEAMVAVVVQHIQFAYRRVLESFAPGHVAEELLAVAGVASTEVPTPARTRPRAKTPGKRPVRTS